MTINRIPLPGLRMRSPAGALATLGLYVALEKHYPLIGWDRTGSGFTPVIAGTGLTSVGTVAQALLDCWGPMQELVRRPFSTGNAVLPLPDWRKLFVENEAAALGVGSDLNVIELAEGGKKKVAKSGLWVERTPLLMNSRNEYIVNAFEVLHARLVRQGVDGITATLAGTYDPDTVVEVKKESSEKGKKKPESTAAFRMGLFAEAELGMAYRNGENPNPPPLLVLLMLQSLQMFPCHKHWRDGRHLVVPGFSVERKKEVLRLPITGDLVSRSAYQSVLSHPHLKHYPDPDRKVWDRLGVASVVRFERVNITPHAKPKNVLLDGVEL